MLLLILVLAIIATLGIAGWFIHNDPGFVQIVFLGKTYELTLAYFSIGLVALLISFLALVYLLLLPATLKNLNAKREMKKALKNIGSASVNMALGDYAKAEGLLMQDVPKGAEITHFYQASKAAHKRARFEQRDHYLQKAATLADDKTQIGIELTHAKMLLESKEHEAAIAILNRLVHKAPKLANAGRVLIEALQSTGDWSALQKYLPTARKNKLFEDSEQAAYEVTLFSQLIGKAESTSALETLWHEAPSSVRNSNACIVAYAKQLAQTGAHDAAERLISARIHRYYAPEITEVFTQLASKDPKTQLSQVEVLLEKHTDEPNLLFKAAQLAAQQELWGKAKSFLERCLEQAETPAVHALLGDVLERSGDGEAAKAQYKQGLALVK